MLMPFGNNTLLSPLILKPNASSNGMLKKYSQIPESNGVPSSSSKFAPLILQSASVKETDTFKIV